MNRDVEVTVTGVQEDSGGNEIVTDLKTPGQYFEKNGCRYLLYRERDADSGAATANTLKIKSGILELSRKGSINSRMIFEPGGTHPAGYATAYGTLQLEVCTEDLKCHFTATGARIQITYRLLMTGELLSRNRLVIKIKNISA